MKRVLVIADDLSGAAEISGIGVRHGLPARLEQEIAGAVGNCALTVIDTETRLLPQDEAAEGVRRAVRHVADQQWDLVYKKTDSALRGAVLAEIEALMDVFARRAALLVAQNPSRGRTIIAGEYRIDGAPLDATSFADDSEHPARTANALELLGRSSRLQTRCVPTSQELDEHAVNIGEAASADDIRRWADRAMSDPGRDVLTAGGADFFAALLQARGLCDSGSLLTALLPGRTLFVCGTAPAFNAALVERAKAERIVICSMPDDSRGAAAALDTWHADARNALDANGRAALVIQRPLDCTPGAASRFQAALAEVAVRLVQTQRTPVNLLIEGGATAAAVCRRMHWSKFDVEGEFAPGVTQMRALAPTEHRIIIKPGSYGWPESVWNASAEAARARQWSTAWSPTGTRTT